MKATVVVVFLLWAWSPFSLIAQTCLPDGITFETQSEVEAFLINYPNCTEILGDVKVLFGEDLEDLEGLDQLTLIGGNLEVTIASWAPVPPNFSGLENLERIGGDFYFDLVFDGIPGFSGLSKLEEIEGDFKFFQARVLSFSGLDRLRSIGGGLIFEESEVTNFLNLKKLESIRDLTINNTAIEEFIGFEGLKSITGCLKGMGAKIQDFTIFRNLETLGCLSFEFSRFLNLDGLEGITELGGLRLENNSQLLQINGLQNVRTIRGGAIEILDNSELLSLNGLENVTTIGSSAIYIDFNRKLLNLAPLRNWDLSNINYISLNSNSLLSVCNEINICNYFAGGGAGSVGLNAPGCETKAAIADACAANLSKVNYRIFYDLNQNKIYDADEALYPAASVRVDPQGFTSFPNAAGEGILFFDNGNYTITYNQLNAQEWLLTTDAASYDLSLSEAGSCDVLYFGIYPNEVITNIATTVNAPSARCNEMIRFEVAANNLGTTILDGMLWLEVDENIDSTAFFTTPDSIATSPDRYGWKIERLFPGQRFSKSIGLQIPGPLDFNLGDTLFFSSYTEYEAGAGTAQSTPFDYAAEVRCSYDPNDKLVSPSRPDKLTLFADPLTYTIRFQNTGNDVAYDVVIRDTLAENLDPTTFQLLGSSHPQFLSTNLAQDRYLTFDFSNIFLPDSSANLAESQGYVTYRINAKEGLAEETLVENTASIYFDLNPPIVTNTTENILVSGFPTNVASIFAGEENLQVIPNPTTGQIFISSDAEVLARLRLSDYTGRLLWETDFNGRLELDLAKFPNGIYFLSAIGAGKMLTKKIIKH